MSLIEEVVTKANSKISILLRSMIARLAHNLCAILYFENDFANEKRQTATRSDRLQ